ncbi:MAG: SCO family protein [Burkholderiales bacterium]|nr:SCO family protein [Burkholderiales bacterium]
MLRTALASAMAIALGYGAASWLTHDFQVWTDEGARRLEVALKPVASPDIAIHGPTTTATTLPALLADEGGVTIVDFVYTHCVTACLALGSVFQQIQQALLADATAGQRDRVRLLSISFDLARDDDAALAAYAVRLHANPGVWRFVRPVDPAGLSTLLRRWGVVVLDAPFGEFEHNAALLVIDRHGRMVRVFDLSEQQLALDYARHLARSVP